MANCYLSIGSNIERDTYIPAALNSLKQQFKLVKLSNVYESKAVGFEGDNFYNLVLHFESDLSIEKITKILRDIEYQHGRAIQTQKFSARTIDLDLLLIDAIIIKNDSLQLPRPDILHYAFILEPLAEIAPLVIHPIIGLNYETLWQQFDKSSIKQQRVNPSWFTLFQLNE